MIELIEQEWNKLCNKDKENINGCSWTIVEYLMDHGYDIDKDGHTIDFIQKTIFNFFKKIK